MPRCPVHDQEALEPKRKGWFCEECGAVVISYRDLSPPPTLVGTEPEGQSSPPPPRELPAEPAPALPATGPRLHQPPIDRRSIGAASRKLASAAIARILARAPASLPYVERSELDDAAASAALRPGRALVLLGDPGVGKTAWAARWVGRLVAPADADDVVIFLSGAESFPRGLPRGQSALCHAVLAACGVDPATFRTVSELLAKLGRADDPQPLPEETPGRVILVIDGIDEADDVEGWVRELDQMLPELASHDWLRLVITMRRESHDALGGSVDGSMAGAQSPFRNGQHLLSFYDVPMRRTTRYVEVRPWREDTEARAAYEAQQAQAPEQCALVLWDRLPHTLRSLVSTPLPSWMLHEAFAGVEELPASLDGPGLAEAWLKSREAAAPAVFKLLDSVGAALMQARSFEPLHQALATWSEARGESELARAERLAQLRACGLFLEQEAPPGAFAWTFRHERFRELVVLRELRRRISPRAVPSSELLLTWARKAGRQKEDAAVFPALCGALELLVTRLVVDGESGFFASLLDIDDSYVCHRLVAASLRALGSCWGEQERGSPAATRLLEVLAAAAIQPERARRLLAASLPTIATLISRGDVRASDELIRRLVAVARSLAGRSQDASDRRFSAQALCAVASLALVVGNREDARRCAEDAMRQAGDTMSASEPDLELLRVYCTSLGQVASLARAEGDRARARNRGEEALRAARKWNELRTDEPAAREAVVQSLLELAELALLEDNAVQARGCAEEAMSIARSGASQFPWSSRLRRFRVEAYAALARVNRAQGARQGGRELTEAALRAMRKLVRAEPQRADYRFELAVLLEHHASHLLVERDDGAARKALDEAAGLMIALVEANPDQRTWLHAVAELLVKLGLILRGRTDSESSRACFNEAVRHARAGASRDGEAGLSRRDLVMALAQLGHLEASDGRRAEARRAFREALEIVRGLPSSGGPLEEPPRVTAILLAAMGQLAAEDGDSEGARWHYTEAVKELTAWMAQRPPRIDVQTELCNVLRLAAELSSDGPTRPRRPARYRFAITVREPGVPEVKEYFDRDEITIGRAPGNDLMLPNYSVSRHHAVVHFEQGRFAIVDLGSKHGIKVNGERVGGRAELAPGDRVDLGDFALQFEAGAETSASEPIAERAPAAPAASDDGAETLPPPPVQTQTPPPAQAAPFQAGKGPPPQQDEARKEITIDLDVQDIVEVLDKPVESS